ncbi:hypothetical protein DFP72DRAFT_1069608 [Ephemerocybe angulata]|uniref:F-box domain-containing protein n=1 Tax=Ephemerocybe angulata TaxID=980116 RepID=A0A8H6M4X3_9AGAR|nr:hypothetical protein DFP72DRAFT_1069608 [Tulosesus angulatus]
MERCLQIPEVLHSICEELNPPDALSMALTSRALLEPGLDSVWYEIKSFDPLISCLPDDLWHVKQVTSREPSSPNISTILFVQKTIRPEHLRRYLTFYAPRIRSFELHTRHCKKLLSMTSWQALQLATDHQPGVLSPSIKECTIYWVSFWMIRRMMGKYEVDIAPYMSLFFGSNVATFIFSLEEVSENEDPLCAASVALMGKRFPHVRDLTFDIPRHRWSLEVAHDFFASSSWNYLQVLSLQHATPRVIRQLATFPCLRSIHIYDTGGERHPDWDAPLPSHRTSGEAGFSALCELDVTLDKITDAIHFLRLMSPSNKLKNLQCCSYAEGCTSQECQSVIEVIRDHCNPLALESVVLLAPEGGYIEGIERIDLAPEDFVDISPLYGFSSLQSLDIHFEGSVQFTQDHFPKISRAWPNLRRLDLCTRFSNPDRMPSVNHHGLLQLLQACPSINSLGLRIDTTQLTPKEKAPVPATFPLKYLYLGDSPICSPSLVIDFLRTHFPSLTSLDTHYIKHANEPQETLLDRRWKVVEETWKELPGLRN